MAAGKSRLRPIHVGALLACWLLLVVAVRFAEPVQDSDLFWHMAYARQMIASGSPIPDHTAYSWTPASNQLVYCAWLGELVLYGVWNVAGLAGMFALRYAVVLAVLAMAWHYARVRGVPASPVTGLLLMLLALASYVGTLTKPECFSLLLLNATTYVYFRARDEDRAGRPAARWLFAVPVIVAVWANTHGGFVLLAGLLLATAVGETINRRVSPACALSPRAYRQLLTAWALCAVAVCLTPYGIEYPRQLLASLSLGAAARPDTDWNSAHLTIWAPQMPWTTFVAYFGIMGALGVALAAGVARRAPRGARLDAALILANLVYMVPYVAGPVRTTYAWPAVFVYSCVHWLAQTDALTPSTTPSRARRALATACLAVLIALGGATIHAARNRPYDGSWLGFGTGYVNPVVEAEFLDRHDLGPRLYNIFDAGGYLLWRLAPRYQVMVDARSFPYLSWFDDQYRFTLGASFDDFLKKYPAHTAIIDLAKRECVRNFLRAPDWRVAFYGPTAAVFVRKDVALPATASGFAPDRFAALRNARTALRVFEFAAAVGDHRTAWQVLAQLETNLASQLTAGELRPVLAYREAHQALRAADFPAARTLFDEALRDRTVGDQDRLIMVLLEKLDAAVREHRTAEADIYRPALSEARRGHDAVGRGVARVDATPTSF